MITINESQGILYHYTSMKVLYELLKNVRKPSDKITLWATHIRYMNDLYEYQYYVKCVYELLKRKELFERPVESFAEKLKMEISASDAFYNEPAVLSLSSNWDNLPMWKAYGQEGKGVAIGFNIKDLKNLENNNWLLHKCQYLNKENIKKQIDIESIKSCSQNEIDDDIIMSKVRELFFRNRTSIKHYSYNYENEWRLVKTDLIEQDYLYRENNGLIIPYTTLEVPADIIVQIILGPTSHPILSLK